MEVKFNKPEADPEQKPRDHEVQETGQWCKDCAIKIPLGYVTCPKCKQRLPGAPSLRVATGTTTFAGARRPSWFLLLLAMAGAGAIYYHFVAESPSEVGAPRAGRAAATATAHNTDGDGGVAAVESEADDGDAGPPATDEAREAALTELVDALGAMEIEATAAPLAGDEGVIVMRSKDCSSQELADIVSEAEETLSQADFHTARCFSPSGVLSYKTSW